MEELKKTIPQLRNQRSDEYLSAYANNVMFEPTVWDLKIIFGQIDQAAGIVDQHTATTLTWEAAKLALYYLSTQIVAHEIFYGKIAIPSDILPAEPPPIPAESKNDPRFQQMRDKFREMHDAFMKNL